MSRNYLKLFFKRISKDLKQKELLPIKFVFFIQTSTILVLYPYLTIHMRELGISVEETAIMSAVTPVIGILMPPVAGIVADKIGNFRIVLAFFSLLGGIAALALLLVPVGRVTVTYPKELILEVSCNSGFSPTLSLYEHYPCTDIKTSLNKTDIAIEACGVICEETFSRNDSDAILKTNEYGLIFSEPDKNRTTIFKYSLLDEDIVIPEPISNPVHNLILRNNKKFNRSIRKMTDSSYFFPVQDLIHFNCLDVPIPTKSNDFDITIIDLLQDGYLMCSFSMKIQHEKFQRNKIKVSANLKEDDENIKDNLQIYDIYSMSDEQNVMLNTSCSKGFKNQENLIINIALEEKLNNLLTYRHLNLRKCKLGCLATAPRENFCSNQKNIIEYDVKYTFWTYLSIRVIIGIIGGTAYTMFEGAVIASLREYKADYGLQRVYASIGGMISSPLSGWLIDFVSAGKDYTDFRPVFYLYAILKSISAFLMLFINLEFKSPAKSVVADVLSLMNVELISLFVTCFLLGSAWGYIESFLFWLIQDLGGSKSLMGLTITVGGILGIPLLVLSGPMVKKIGHANIIFIGFIAYAIRLVGYSVIYNPWYSLIFEAMECFTHSLCFTAAITYAAKLSSPTTDSTIQGIFGGLFYGVGRSAGSLVGGYLITLYGIRRTFQIFAATTGLTGIFYLLFYHLYMKSRSGLNKSIDEKKEPEKMAHAVEEDIIKNKEKENNEEILTSLPYEEAVTNLGYEETETDAVDDDDEEEEKDKSKNQSLNDVKYQ